MRAQPARQDLDEARVCGARAKIYNVARLVVPDVGQVARRPLDRFLGVRTFGVVAHAREVAIDLLAARQAVLMQLCR